MISNGLDKLIAGRLIASFLWLLKLPQVLDDVEFQQMFVKVLLAEANLDISVLTLNVFETLLLLLLFCFALFGPDLLLGAEVLHRHLIQWIIVHQFVGDVV